MNNRAIIFQRSSVGSDEDRAQELVRLQAYANQHALIVMSIYVASGEPNMLTMGMLIEHCMAWAQPGHVIVSDPGLLWIGDGIDDIVRMLEAAGAVLRVVPQVVA